ncbi:MAG: PDZ domain-containing protein [Deltaproteobacteria bacterium]|nr:PDZ domain-containing protein [Deltaproteobacteria bacterium]
MSSPTSRTSAPPPSATSSSDLKHAPSTPRALLVSALLLSLGALAISLAALGLSLYRAPQANPPSAPLEPTAAAAATPVSLPAVAPITRADAAPVEASGAADAVDADSNARNPALGNEAHTIALFHRTEPAVVYITSLDVRLGGYKRDALEIPRGTGSGFVWDTEGHIVTNFHVVREGGAARVTLSDGSVWPARLVGYAADYDTAVLKIDAPANLLSALAIGTSHDLSVGQEVLAIGNPFGLDHSLSRGIISGLSREIRSVSGRPIQGVIQTDAAINPGNSGGPLLDSSGRLVGMNTAIYSPSGASAGIGFAIPVDIISRVVPQLITSGRVVRPQLGVTIAERELQERLGVDGVLVMQVGEGTPAARAGLRATRRDPQTGATALGDLIVAIDGEPVHAPRDVYRLLDAHEIGDTVQVSVKRATETVDVPVTLGAGVSR